jgi:hypothetical protein
MSSIHITGPPRSITLINPSNTSFETLPGIHQ